jgi:hypothetical protein
MFFLLVQASIAIFASGTGLIRRDKVKHSAAKAMPRSSNASTEKN